MTYSEKASKSTVSCAYRASWRQKIALLQIPCSVTLFRPHSCRRTGGGACFWAEIASPVLFSFCAKGTAKT